MKPKVYEVINNLKSLLGELIEINEGLVKLLAPNLAKYSQGRHIEPRWAPVFYNPLTVISRNIDILVMEVYRNIYKSRVHVCDLLSATGIRGIRYLVESNADWVVFNDIDKRAYELIKINVLLNEVEDRATIYNLDANLLLSFYTYKKGKFDVIDIDPFGTPVLFIDSALRAVRNGGMLSVTATDLAPLLGVKNNACLRKYQAISMKVPFSREIAVRILIGYLSRQAAKYELAVIPVFSYSLLHIVRVHVLVRRGAIRADETLRNMGYARYCSNCGYRDLVREYPATSLSVNCPNCHRKLLIAGPLWTGSLWDLDFVDEVYQAYREKAYLHERHLLNILKAINRESRAPPLYYSVKEFSRAFRVREVSPKTLINELRSKGFLACKTHFDPKGFKTNATINIIRDFILSIVKGG